MYRRFLQSILNRAETEEMLFGWEEVSEWPDGVLDLLLALELLRTASPASSMDCSDCERGCIAASIGIVARPNGTQQAFLECPEYLRVEIPIDHLNRWQVDMDSLAATLARELDCGAEEMIPCRLWMIGALEIGGVRTDILLARGLAWEDGNRVLREARNRRRGRTVVVLTPSRNGGDMASDGSIEFLPLNGVLDLDGGALDVDLSAVREAALRTQAGTAVAPVDGRHACRYLFKKGVDTWAIVYDGKELFPPLSDMKGLHYLAFLLAHPSQEGHYALQLVHEIDGTPYEPSERYAGMTADQLAEENLTVGGFTDAGEIMDSEYEADCRSRLKQALEELSRAQSRNDYARIQKAKHEIAQYRRALSEGIGKRGRHRTMDDKMESARTAVTRAIRRALEKIQKQHTKLYEHLTSSIHTGKTCSYDPPSPIDWQF